MNKFEILLVWLGQYKDGLSLIVTLFTGLGIVIGAYWAFSTWQDQREREILKPIFEQHIKVTSSIYEIVAKMQIEKDSQKLKDLSSQFWAVYFGGARQFLSPETMNGLSYVARYVAKCVDNIPDESKDIPCELFSGSTSMLAKQARIDISTRILKDGLKGMTNLDPYVSRKIQSN